MSLRHFPPKVAGLLIPLVFALACAPESAPNPTEPLASFDASRDGGSNTEATRTLDAVFAGNAQGIAAAPTLVPPGAPLAPFIEARLYAIANIAMHDALNGVVPRFARYADDGVIDHDANAAAAVLTAAHDAIVGAAPGSQSSTDAWYASAIAALGSPEGFAAGVAVGHRAATAILARRATDGVAAGGVAPYHPGGNPGDYAFTFPFNTPGFDFFGTGGFADASNWGGSVTPFVLTSTSQFRPGPPYGASSNAEAVLTRHYTRDFNEVKAIGCATCSARTAEQTEIALFWMENSPTGWNRIARSVAQEKRLDASDAARLLAVLAIGEFDAYTASLEAKYHYNFWRPVSAVALAETDGNPLTSSAADWQVLAFPTPPVPDYPSAHSTAGGAAAAIIEALTPGRSQHFTTTSGSLAGVSRTFSSVAEAAEENAASRVYIGYHFRHATKVGVRQGRAVGNYVVTNTLLPLRGGHER
jgi:hypothetical protein